MKVAAGALEYVKQAISVPFSFGSTDSFSASKRIFEEKSVGPVIPPEEVGRAVSLWFHQDA